MPLLEELQYIPSEKYSHQPELLLHSKMIAEKYHLYDNALFQTTVTGMQWDAATSLWTVQTNQHDCFTARFVFMNFGTFPKPKLPGVPGLSSFQGHMFHTSRWDYRYTGGSPTDNQTSASIIPLDQLKHKKVAIVGTGATAVQVVPHLGLHAKHLYVFQRTPSSVDVRGNKLTTETFVNNNFKDIGWQRKRMSNFTNMTMSYTPGVVDQIQDGWTKPLVHLNQILIEKRQELIALAGPKESGKGSGMVEIKKKLSDMMALADMRHMHGIRERVVEIVKDTKTANELMPWYQQFCKRPCFHGMCEMLLCFFFSRVNSQLHCILYFVFCCRRLFTDFQSTQCYIGTRPVGNTTNHKKGHCMSTWD